VGTKHSHGTFVTAGDIYMLSAYKKTTNQLELTGRIHKID